METSKLIDRDVHADVGIGPEPDALFGHDVQPPVEDLFLHLEFGNAIAQQSTRSVSPLEDCNGVSGSSELLGGS